MPTHSDSEEREELNSIVYINSEFRISLWDFKIVIYTKYIIKYRFFRWDLSIIRIIVMMMMR